MDKKQDAIAEDILILLANNNGCFSEKDVDFFLLKKYGDSFSDRKNRLFVKERMLDDYHLIKRKNNLLMLSDNGETASRIGINFYLKYLHKNQRLDLKIKKLEFFCRVFEVLKQSHSLFIAIIEFLILFILILEYYIQN